ncbi:DMT family transporter [Thalassospira lucentensis]|uniref:DMT family transporter n=1 Tax=Thalassospira lucentensis TaxID=168935 RepID=UPI0003B3FDC7|nr:DMT family transporter [Thalassospira lucentensis]
MPVLVLLFTTTLFWAMLLVCNRIALTSFDIDPYAMTCWQLVFGGIALVLMAPGRRIPWRQFTLPINWAYGILRVITGVTWTAALVYISAPQSGILSQTGMPLAALAATFILGRPPGRSEWLGHAALIAGAAWLAWHLPGGFTNPAVLLMLASEVTAISSSVLAEKHPDNQIKDAWAHLRFTGVLLLITASIFLAVPPLVDLISPVPIPYISTAGLFGTETLIAGLLIGVLFRGPAMVLSLRSIKTAGIEKYILSTSVLPFILLGLEMIAARFGLAPTPAHDSVFWISSLLVMIGIVQITVSKQRHSAKLRALGTEPIRIET